jgi:hypothetical protein
MSTTIDVFTGLDDNGVSINDANFQAYKQQFHFFIQLTAEDRMAVNAVAKQRLPLIQQAQEFANSYKKELMLSDEALDRFNRISFDYQKLDAHLERVRVFHEGLDDTVLQIGSNCYADSLMIKDLAELAIKRGIPGMEHVYNELAKYWERATAPKKKDETSTETPDGGPNPKPIPGNEPA